MDRSRSSSSQAHAYLELAWFKFPIKIMGVQRFRTNKTLERLVYYSIYSLFIYHKVGNSKFMFAFIPNSTVIGINFVRSAHLTMTLVFNTVFNCCDWSCVGYWTVCAIIVCTSGTLLCYQVSFINILTNVHLNLFMIIIVKPIMRYHYYDII